MTCVTRGMRPGKFGRMANRQKGGKGSRVQGFEWKDARLVGQKAGVRGSKGSRG
jgi:hypothetical protein